MNKLEPYKLMKSGELVDSGLTTQYSKEQSRRVCAAWAAESVPAQYEFQSGIRSQNKTSNKGINEKTKEKIKKSKSWF